MGGVGKIDGVARARVGHDRRAVDGAPVRHRLAARDRMLDCEECRHEHGQDANHEECRGGPVRFRPASIVLGRLSSSFPPGVAQRLLSRAPTAAIA